MVIDERLMEHRLRSTSIAGIAGGVLAAALFVYRYTHDHVFSRDLLAVAVAVALVKWGMMAWYRLTE